MQKRWLAGAGIGAFVLLLLCVVGIGIGSRCLPESISVFADEALPEYPCFSLDEPEETEGEETVSARLFGIIPVKEIEVRKYGRVSLVPGGFVFGAKMLAYGVTVSGFSDVPCGGVRVSPARDAGILPGDVIVKAEGREVLCAGDVTALLERSDGSPITFTLLREAAEYTVTVTPRKSDADGKYKTGIWVRDSSSGIGTVTFVDPATGAFGGLGHGICDADSGELLSFRRGSVSGVHISGVMPGVPGTPGEIRGTLLHDKCGSILSNTPSGVFGVLQTPPPAENAIPIALSGEVHTGNAEILCTLDDGATARYAVKITALHRGDGTRSFTVRVTDPALLERTGGIVQGMSGSPVIQDGKLVGAVTHVLINDPAGGYGIFVENMLDAMPEEICPK